MSTPTEPQAVHAAREVAIVALLITACVLATYLDAHQLASMLGGAACALVVPRAGTMTRAVVVAGAVTLAAVAGGCSSGAALPARATCRGAAALLSMVCEHVPETVGGEAPQ